MIIERSMEDQKDGYQLEIQQIKNDLHEYFRKNKNKPVTMMEMKRWFGRDLLVSLEDVLESRQENDDFVFHCTNEEAKDRHKRRYILKIPKLPKIQNINQLEDFLREKKGQFVADQVIFESTYQGIQDDLLSLEQQGMLLVTDCLLNKKCRLYLLQDKIFENYIGKLSFKRFFEGQYKLSELKNIEEIRKNKDANDIHRAKQSNNKKGTSIVNEWIPGLKEELEKCTKN